MRALWLDHLLMWRLRMWLYVAMTRACERLYLTYTSSDRSRPSRFLAGIQAHCTEMEYANKKLTAID